MPTRKERVAIVSEINDIIDEHCHHCEHHYAQDYTAVCVGCPVLDRLKELGAKLSGRVDKKGLELKAILSKGEDMKVSEIVYLIENGVPKRQISKALGMYPATFNTMVLRIYKGLKGEVAG